MECLKYVCIDSSIQTTTEWMTQQQYAYSDGNLSQTGKCSLALTLSSWSLVNDVSPATIWMVMCKRLKRPPPPPPLPTSG